MESGSLNLYTFEGEYANYADRQLTFDGGSGTDTIYYYGPSSDFTIETSGEETEITSLISGQSDTLVNVEKVVFVDGTSLEEVVFRLPVIL